MVKQSRITFFDANALKGIFFLLLLLLLLLLLFLKEKRPFLIWNYIENFH